MDDKTPIWRVLFDLARAGVYLVVGTAPFWLALVVIAASG